MSSKKRAHVAAFAFPFGSHPIPLLHLVQRLASSAPDVRFSYLNTKASNQRLLSNTSQLLLHGYDNIRTYDVEDGKPEGHVFSRNPLEPIEFFIKATPDNFRTRLDRIVEETGSKVTCLVTDAFLWFSCDIAKDLAIPWVALWTSGPTAISLHMYTDEIHRRLGQSGDTRNEDQTLDFITGMSSIRIRDLPQEFVELDKPFARLLHSMSLSLPQASAVVLNSFDNLDPLVENDLRTKLRRLLTIGPFPSSSSSDGSCNDHDQCISWLNKHGKSSVAYISFGTMLTPPPHELTALAEALEEKKIPYLWSFRDTGGSIKDLLSGFFDRTKDVLGKVVQWAPQSRVLSHYSVGVFITHCGWNSVMESVTGGVPMICRPFFGDQTINKRVIEDVWGIGIGVESGVFGKESVGKCLDVVLARDEGKRMRENVERLRDCALKAVDDDNGSSTANFKALFDIAAS